MSLEILGAETSPPSRDDVYKFQGLIMKLPPERQDPAFLAMTKAINTQTNASGEFGPLTKAAAKVFNKRYGRQEDGDNITAFTLSSFTTRPELQPGYDAKAEAAKLAADSAAYDAQEALAIAAQKAVTPGVVTPAEFVGPPAPAVKAETAAVAAKVETAAAKVADIAPTPEAKAKVAEVQAKIVEAKNDAAKAMTSEEMSKAQAEMKALAEQIQKLAAGKKGSWFTEPMLGPIPGYGVVAGGAGILVALSAIVIAVARR